jgi:hypothetical protein
MISKAILIATVATFGLVGYASAQEMKEGTAIHVTSKGKSHVVNLTKAHHEKMMKMGHEIPAGAIIYRSGGKTYLLENTAGTSASKTMIQQEFPELEPDSSEY